MAMARFLGASVGALWRERRYDAAAFERRQRAALRRTLAHAQSRTRLGAERLAGVDLETADPFEVLRGLAPVTKSELMARFEDTIEDGALTLDQVRRFTADRDQAGRALDGRYVCATTSGTTGRVGYFVTDVGAWAALNGALFARILRHRLVPHEILRFSPARRYRMAMTVATEGHFITRLVSTYRPWLARGMMTMETFSITDPIERVCEGLNAYRPHYLHAYPTYLEVLAQAQLEGRLDIDPEFVSLGSEPVSALARETFRRAFPNAEVSETYGATECLPIANQCKQGHLHVNLDYCVLEPDGDRVYVTNLVNRAQPLVRYQLDDRVTAIDEPCACGTALPRIQVEGRSDDVFFLSDPAGRYHALPPVPFEVLFLDVPGLEQYQLVHEAQNELSVRVVTAPGADVAAVQRQLEGRFGRYLADRGLAESVRVRVSPVPRLERQEPGHKLRQVWSKVPRPVAA